MLEVTGRDVARVDYSDYDLLFCLRRLLQESRFDSDDAALFSYVQRVFAPHDAHRGIKCSGDRVKGLVRLAKVDDETFLRLSALPEAVSWSANFRLDILPASFFHDEKGQLK